MEWQTKGALQRIEKQLDALEKKGRKHHLMTASGLSVVDIFHDGEWGIRAPAGSLDHRCGQLQVHHAEERVRRSYFVNVGRSLLFPITGQMFAQYANQEDRAKECGKTQIRSPEVVDGKRHAGELQTGIDTALQASEY